MDHNNIMVVTDQELSQSVSVDLWATTCNPDSSCNG